MRKEDLKTGMLCQFRNGDVGLLINNSIVEIHDGMHTKYLKKDLTHETIREYDIIKVSSVLDDFNPAYWTKETLNANLLWEREEATEMTIKEIEEILNISNLKIKK